MPTTNRQLAYGLCRNILLDAGSDLGRGHTRTAFRAFPPRRPIGSDQATGNRLEFRPEFICHWPFLERCPYFKSTQRSVSFLIKGTAMNFFRPVGSLIELRLFSGCATQKQTIHLTGNIMVEAQDSPRFHDSRTGFFPTFR
jgi:hypothetical protein